MLGAPGGEQNQKTEFGAGACPVMMGSFGARVAGQRGCSAPAFMTITGGSVGAQVGAQAVDVVPVVINRRGLQNLVNNRFKVGANAGVAAGPVGRDASASTDVLMRAEILSYSRSRGLFAGISLDGASFRADQDANRRFYGKKFRTADIVFRGMAGGTGLVGDWQQLLAQYA